MIRHIVAVAAAALACGLASAPAQALTMRECSATYQAAKEKNALKGMKWNDFRKAECGGDEDASEADAAAAVKEDDANDAKTAKPAASGKVTFPSEIAQKYAAETPGKARLHTCVDQYKANKATGGNGDLKWIQKGGGYYSQCNAKLKG